MNSSNRRQAASIVELIAVFLALSIVAITQVVAARRLDLFSHPLWLDETFTSRIANDPSFIHMLAAIRGGVDTNPPTLYLMLWPIARIFGTLSNTELRVISVLWMLFGMTGLYAICRRYFARSPSLVAVLAIWAHPLIIDQAFETRYYAPWLALTTWFSYLQMQAGENESKLHRIARYVLGILATAIHYFGVIAMTMIAAVDLLIHRRIKREIPILIGLLTVAACLPFMLGQRAGLSISTWIQPVNASDIKDAIVIIFGAPSIIAVLLLMWIARLLSNVENTIDPSSTNFRELLPLSSLLLFPAAIVVFSVVMQPALVSRYLILAIIPLTPMLAALIERSGRLAIAAAVFGLIGLGAVTMVAKSNATRGMDSDFATTISQIDRRVPPDGMIVFKRRHDMHPILLIRPDLVARSAQLDFDDSVLPNVTRMSQYERDMGRKVQKIYPELRMVNSDELARLGKFYIVGPTDEFRELQLQLPGFDVADPDDVLHEVTLKR